MSDKDEAVSRQRVAYYDFLNVLACAAVVIMHANGAFWSFRTRPSWVLNLIIEKSCLWAVPVFFMLSGATLMNYRGRMDSREYALRRISRTVLPFLAWSLIGLFYGIFVGDIPSRGYLSYYAELILNTSVSVFSIYWFFPPLFSVYLAIPVLSLVPVERRVSAFSYLVVSALVLTTFAEILPLFGIQWNAELKNPLVGGWLLYPLLGYVLSQVDFTRCQRVLLYVAGVAGWLLITVGTGCSSFTAGELSQFIPSWLALPTVCEASAVFVATRAAENRLPEKVRGGGSLAVHI